MNRFGIRTVALACALGLAASAFGLSACAGGQGDVGGEASVVEAPAQAGSSASTATSAPDSKYLETVASDAYDAAVAKMDLEYSKRDMDQEPDTSGAASIVFSGTSAQVDGTGASVEEGMVTITEEGCYKLSGSFQGQVRVSCPEDAKVQIVLDGASIECADGPAIFIEQADKAFVTTAAGTQNSLSDAAEYADGEDGPNGALYSEADLTINGSGSLKVSGHYRHGISSKDDLVVTGGTLEVDAVEDALHGKDCVKVAGGDLTLQAGEDGIKSTSTKDLETRGFIVIDGGSISVSAGNDGLHAESVMAVNGGSVDISTCEEGFEGQKVFMNGGETRLASHDDGLNASASGSSTAQPVPGQAIEGCLIEINGGYHVIKSEGDGVDSNGTLAFNGGITLVSGPAASDDNAIDSEESPVVNGGVVMAAGGIGMSEDFTSQTQAFASVQVKGSAGQSVAVVDPAGDLLLAFTPQTDFELVQVTSPAFQDGSECQLLVGASVDTASVDGYADDSTDASASGGEASALTPSLEQTLQGGRGGFGGGSGMKGDRMGRSFDGGADPSQMPDGGGSFQKPDGSAEGAPMPDGQAADPSAGGVAGSDGAPGQLKGE